MTKSIVLILFLALCSCATPPPPAQSARFSPPTYAETPVPSESKPTETESKNKITNNIESKNAETFYKQARSNPAPLETRSKIWELLSDEDGIKTYRETNPARDIVSFRGEATLNTSIEKLAAVLSTPELRKEWVDSLAETHTIERTNALDRIEYVRASVPWPFQDRDFVFRVQITLGQAPESIFIKMNSVDDPREPPHPGVVRGNILHAYYFLKDVSTPQAPATQVIVEIAADPKGSIPTWIVNLTQKNWPNNTLHALEKVSRREDLFRGLARVP